MIFDARHASEPERVFGSGPGEVSSFDLVRVAQRLEDRRRDREARARLWRERVARLRELVGVEARP